MQHPDVCMARNTKETNFFNREYARGIDWYKSFFEQCESSNAVGEISNLYFYDPEVPGRIYQALPHVKLVTVLRNPFDRLISAFNHRKSTGEIDNAIALEEAVRMFPNLITDNLYFDHLSPYLALFPREQFLITFFDDLEKDPVGFMESVLEFIGVDSTRVPDVIREKTNPSVELRIPAMGPVVRTGANILRKTGLFKPLVRLKSSRIVRRSLYKSGKDLSSSIPPEVLERCHAQFEEQIREMEKLTGRDLKVWYRPGSHD
jgi:hypothetical protein